MDGIRFNGKHSSKDFGLTIKNKQINPPQKIKIKETVPFMQGSYDFSLLYGDQTYSERDLKYTFNLIAENKIQLNTQKIKINNWLLNCSKDRLIDDNIPGYYFDAECEDIDFNENGRFAEITVNFKAYPFKLSEEYQGQETWDNFNFELDLIQDTKFSINQSRDIKIINKSSKAIVPTIISNSNFTIIKGNLNFEIVPGTIKDFRFKLDPDENNFKILGSGDLEILFRKEVL